MIHSAQEHFYGRLFILNMFDIGKYAVDLNQGFLQQRKRFIRLPTDGHFNLFRSNNDF